MAHPYRIREIAAQSGLSEATIDRVLNERSGVRASTAREVQQAIEDLDRQQAQIRLTGQTFMIDVVVQAPERFSAAIRNALESELPFLRPAVIRSRFHFRETGVVEDVVADLDRIAKRGSHGIVLKAPDDPEVVAAVNRLDQLGIPVITLVTDLPTSRRRAYVGMDNRAAGKTAALLVDRWSREEGGQVLVTLSRTVFLGEEEREMGFRSAMRRMDRPRDIVEITDSDGLDSRLGELVAEVLEAHADVRAVYSAGGGNSAILGAFDEAQRRCDVFVAHDLDADNVRLLKQGRVSAVLHHDLHQDMRTACQIILQANRGLPGKIAAEPSAIQIVTPFNMPGHVRYGVD